MLTEKDPLTEKKDLFEEAEVKWDLERLCADLAKVKGASLTPTEELHLRGLLCGHTSAEVAGMCSDAQGSGLNLTSLVDLSGLRTVTTTLCITTR